MVNYKTHFRGSIAVVALLAAAALRLILGTHYLSPDYGVALNLSARRGHQQPLDRLKNLFGLAVH